MNELYSCSVKEFQVCQLEETLVRFRKWDFFNIGGNVGKTDKHYVRSVVPQPFDDTDVAGITDKKNPLSFQGRGGFLLISEDLFQLLDGSFRFDCMGHAPRSVGKEDFIFPTKTTAEMFRKAAPVHERIQRGIFRKN